MEVSNIIFEPTEEDEDYVESFFNYNDEELIVDYDNYCMEAYL